MKYTFSVNHHKRDLLGRPDTRFACSDCGTMNIWLTSFFWRATLVSSPITDLEVAAEEFVAGINAGKFDTLFHKRTTAKACENTCCNCTGAARGRLLRALERHNQIENDGGAA